MESGKPGAAPCMVLHAARLGFSRAGWQVIAPYLTLESYESLNGRGVIGSPHSLPNCNYAFSIILITLFQQQRTFWRHISPLKQPKSMLKMFIEAT